MSEYSVRLTTATDALFIAELSRLPHVAGQLNPVEESDVVAALLQAPKISLVITSNQRAVAHVLSELQEGWYLGIRFLAVAYERRGIGKFTLDWILHDAFVTRGLHRVALEVPTNNVAARALYERCGMLYEGTQRDGMRDVRTGAFRDLANYAILRSEWKS